MLVLMRSDNFIAPIAYLYALEIKLYSKYEYMNMDVCQILCEFVLAHLIVKSKLAWLNVVRRNLFAKREQMSVFGVIS